MPLEWINSLAAWQWLVVGLAASGIVALYFLRLKRRPVEVPSTYLWRASVEDLHANALWQRLVTNPLLALQLLLMLLAALALLGPGWKGSQLEGDRFVFLIDNSASMQAVDLGRSRLDEAKRQARDAITRMKPGDAGMVVSFAATARIEQAFSDSRRQLLAAIDRIAPTFQTTALAEAFRLASGLANPGRSASDIRDQQVAEPLPASLWIFSDGRFDDPEDVTLGYLNPVYRAIGSSKAQNVAVEALSVRPGPTGADRWHAWARVRNYGPSNWRGSLELWLGDELVDAAQLQVAAGMASGFETALTTTERGTLRVELDADDALDLDDRAWALVGDWRRAAVLLVTPGNRPLELALLTAQAQQKAIVEVASPQVLADRRSDYYRNAADGTYRLVIFDRCRPLEMPQANTLFIAELPPPAEADGQAAWQGGKAVDGPQIIDVDGEHPLMQWLDLGDVLVASARTLTPPAGAAVLIDSDRGPLLALAPRDQFEDAVLGFSLIETAASRTAQFNTNWVIRPSFPLWVLNVLDYLGRSGTGGTSQPLRPGDAVTLDAAPASKVDVITPLGESLPVTAGAGGYTFAGTGELGVYQVQVDGRASDYFAVNLLDAAESDIRVRDSIGLGHIPVAGQRSALRSARHELWRYLVAAGLFVLTAEWFVYRRRVA